MLHFARNRVEQMVRQGKACKRLDDALIVGPDGGGLSSLVIGLTCTTVPSGKVDHRRTDRHLPRKFSILTRSAAQFLPLLEARATKCSFPTIPAGRGSRCSRSWSLNRTP